MQTFFRSILYCQISYSQKKFFESEIGWSMNMYAYMYVSTYIRLFHYFLKLILAQWREAYRILCVSRAQIQNLSKIGPKLKLSGLCPAQLERRQIWQIGSTWLLKIVSGPRQLQLWSNLAQILDLGFTNTQDSAGLTPLGFSEW